MAAETVKSDIVVESASATALPTEQQTSAPPPVAQTPEPETHEEDHEHEAEDDDSQDDAPKADASEAARTLAGNRLTSRRARLNEDAALLEDNLRRMGASVPTKDVRTYKNPQDEIAHLVRHRHDLTRALNEALRRGPAPAAPRQTPPAPKPAAAAAVEAPPAEEPKFKFDSWERYQELHPEADYPEYSDARQDARDAFNEARKEFARQKQADAEANEAAERNFRTAVDSFEGHKEAFKASHVDYDAVTKAIALNPAHPSTNALRMATLRAGIEGPSIVYYLAQHPEELAALQNTQSMGEFAEQFGAVKYAARQAFPASGGEPRAQAHPKPSAPNPIKPVIGSARTAPSLRDLADDDSEEATDRYIAERRKVRAGQGR